MIAGMFTLASLYGVALFYASVINKSLIDRDDVDLTNQQLGKFYIIFSSACDGWLLIGIIDDCLQVSDLPC